MVIFLIWYIVILGIGMVYMPLSMLLFDGWNDRGWIFSKSLGILAGAYAMWVLNCMHRMRFRTLNCFLMLLLPAAVFGILFLIYRRRYPAAKKSFPWKRILGEEIAFFLLMALWTYIIGFRPEAYGTEKFMDYGFMTSMLRSDYMPFADPWYAGEAVNYYYGGQYIAAWLVRLSQVRAGEGYNLMRALIAAMSCMLPFSLTSQMMADRLNGLRGGKNSAGSGMRNIAAEIAAGTAAGCAVAFCGNFHYVIYGIIVPLIKKINGTAATYYYWFPDSTRYIGYHPDTEDKTIHEFPSYSTVLGDLHAHYINILFVVLVTAVVYAWARRQFMENERLAFRNRLMTHRNGAENLSGTDSAAGQKHFDSAAAEEQAEKVFSFIRGIFRPEILLIGLVTGLFRWTNFWDFPIYYVVCGSIIFFTNLRRYRKSPKIFWTVMIAEAAVMFLCGKIAALPFTSTFDQISSEIGKTHSHSPLYQLLILWWLPVTVSVWFIAARIRERVQAVRAAASEAAESGKNDESREDSEPETPGIALEERSEDTAREKWIKVKHALQTALTAFLDFFENLTLPDMAAVLFAACAMGLVWMPEVIYVKDIYTASHYRANTMFKLTYQAFILFGIVMGYVLVRAIVLYLEEASARSASFEAVRTEESEGGRTGEAAFDGEKRRSGKNGFAGEDRQTGKIAFTGEDRRIGKAAFAGAVVGLVMLALTGGFIFRSVHDWFGNIFRPSERISTDASVFISEDFPNDFGAVAWLNSHVPDQPVILEANGDSYSDYGRVSVATGLPTVMGWYVHEWLWRNNTAVQNLRVQDIETIYTSDDEEMVRVLIDKYHIRYIYIGGLEREKFPELNDALLQRLGEVAYSDGKTTYIMRIGE
ncbi:MAG: hypothetical protein E7240_00245 [Lachnospiraceae bacterium]|nr:hypothetical protein [Lachnospiraceae bacterium]